LPYIYKVTNNINGKIYVGKTLHSIEKRWKEHCLDYKKERCEKRPLYRAMKKYGQNNFSIEQLEECDADILNEREIFWIEKLGSFKHGYNATIGGDGKQFVDINLIYSLWDSEHNIREISGVTNYDEGTIKKWLAIRGISKEEIKNRKTKNFVIPVAMIDINTDKILKVFSSITEAEKELKDNGKHISSVCKGKRKTAKGYKWKYVRK